MNQTGDHCCIFDACDHKGYLIVGLIINDKLSTRKVHRLVAEAFIPNPENKLQVNHKNSIKTDNRVENLEWVTPKENVHHSIKSGTFVFITPEKSINLNPKKGELNGQSILTSEQVIKIRNEFKPRVCTRKILAVRYGVSEHTIKDIVTRKSWSHI